MTLKSSRSLAALLVSIFLVGSTYVHAKPNSKGADSSIVVGTLTDVDSSGRTFHVQQTGESLRKLHLDSQSKVYFVGFSKKNKQEPQAGFGVKASCEKDGQIKTITFNSFKESSAKRRQLNMTHYEFKSVCMLSGTDYNHSRFTIFTTMGLFYKYLRKRRANQSFYDWLIHIKSIDHNDKSNLVNSAKLFSIGNYTLSNVQFMNSRIMKKEVEEFIKKHDLNNLSSVYT